MDKLTVNVSRIVGGGVCISTQDGHKVYDVIRSGILADKTIELSFQSITRITTAFLNAAVGQLYSEFTEERIRRQLAPPINADDRVLARLKLVVDRAKVFFEDQRKADQIVAGITGIDDDE